MVRLSGLCDDDPLRFDGDAVREREQRRVRENARVSVGNNSTFYP
jgi:hypothetical protein